MKERLLELAELYQTEEFLIITNIYNWEDKKESYRLIAEQFHS